MSVHVMSWVLRYSETKRSSDRLVLLVLADHAKDDGTAAWPSVETMAEQARLSERGVQNSLRRLEEAGAIVETGRSKSGTHIYTVVMGGARPAPRTTRGGARRDAVGVQVATNGGANPAPDPSLEQPSRTRPSATARARDPIWDALTDLFGEARTETAKSLRGKIVRSLKAAGATEEQIRAAPGLWRKKMPPDTTFTETALEKHWGFLLARPPGAASACEECGVGGGHHADGCSRVVTDRDISNVMEGIHAHDR